MTHGGLRSLAAGLCATLLLLAVVVVGLGLLVLLVVAAAELVAPLDALGHKALEAKHGERVRDGAPLLLVDDNVARALLERAHVLLEERAQGARDEDAVLVGDVVGLAALVGDPLAQLEVDTLDDHLGPEPRVLRALVLEVRLDLRDLARDRHVLEVVEAFDPPLVVLLALFLHLLGRVLGNELLAAREHLGLVALAAAPARRAAAVATDLTPRRRHRPARVGRTRARGLGARDRGDLLLERRARALADRRDRLRLERRTERARERRGTLLHLRHEALLLAVALLLGAIVEHGRRRATEVRRQGRARVLPPALVAEDRLVREPVRQCRERRVRRDGNVHRREVRGEDRLSVGEHRLLRERLGNGRELGRLRRRAERSAPKSGLAAPESDDHSDSRRDATSGPRKSASFSGARSALLSTSARRMKKMRPSRSKSASGFCASLAGRASTAAVRLA